MSTECPLVSIVIPAKDEAENLPALLADIKRELALIRDYSFELIIVDDHCTDSTADLALAAGAVVVRNHRKPGKGNALISGFEKANGRYFIMMDADRSHRPQDIASFLRGLEKGHGLVVGSRSTGGSDEYTLIRTLGNVGLSAVFRFMTGVSITDILNGYKAFRREVFSNYRYTSVHFEIEIELAVNTLREGLTLGEFACHEESRAAGEAKSRVIKHGTLFLWAIIKGGVIYRTEKFLRLFKQTNAAH